MTTLKAANRIEQEAERRSRKCRPIVTCMEQVPVLTEQEADAAHPAPARGRGKRNASGSGMPAGSGSCPSSASSGAVEAKCQQEAEAVQAGKMVLQTEALVLSDCGSDGVPSFMVSFW